MEPTSDPQSDTQPGVQPDMPPHSLEPAPEDFLPSPPKVIGPFQRWPSKDSLLLPAIFLLVCIGFSATFWSVPQDLFSASGLHVWQRQEYWRLLTAVFTHGDLSHIGFNAMPLLFFGWLLFAYFGWLAFPVVPLLLGIGSNAITIALYPASTTLIGASGMVYGMIALWLVLYIRFDKHNDFVHKSARVVGFILMLLFPHAYEPNISYLAHASGFLLGLLASVILLPLVRLREPPPVAAIPRSRRYYRIVRVRRGD